MKLPRDVGSHYRVTTTQAGEHHVTIPRHDPLRIGTFAAILDDMAEHFGISRGELIVRIDIRISDRRVSNHGDRG